MIKKIFILLEVMLLSMGSGYVQAGRQASSEQKVLIKNNPALGTLGDEKTAVSLSDRRRHLKGESMLGQHEMRSFTFNTQAQPPLVTLSGFIKEKGSLESLPGAAVFIPSIKKGAVANNYGFYSLTVPAGSYDIEFSFVGFAKVTKRVDLNKNFQLDVELGAMNVLEEVTIVATKENQKISETTQMSTVQVPIEQIKDVPSLAGEKDVFKVLQLLPGVQKASEGFSGFYVRGGALQIKT